MMHLPGHAMLRVPGIQGNDAAAWQSLAENSSPRQPATTAAAGLAFFPPGNVGYLSVPPLPGPAMARYAEAVAGVAETSSASHKVVKSGVSITSARPICPGAWASSSFHCA